MEFFEKPYLITLYRKKYVKKLCAHFEIKHIFTALLNESHLSELYI